MTGEKQVTRQLHHNSENVMHEKRHHEPKVNCCFFQAMVSLSLVDMERAARSMAALLLSVVVMVTVTVDTAPSDMEVRSETIRNMAMHAIQPVVVLRKIE